MELNWKSTAREGSDKTFFPTGLRYLHPILSNCTEFFLDIRKIVDKLKEIRGFEMLSSDPDVIAKKCAGWVGVGEMIYCVGIVIVK